MPSSFLTSSFLSLFLPSHSLSLSLSHSNSHSLSLSLSRSLFHPLCVFQANSERRHNLIVVVPSTPAQYFHCLRRQIHRCLLSFILYSSNVFIYTHSSILYVFFSYYHGLLFLLFSSRPSISHLSSLLFLPLLSSLLLFSSFCLFRPFTKPLVVMSAKWLLHHKVRQ